MAGNQAQRPHVMMLILVRDTVCQHVPTENTFLLTGHSDDSVFHLVSMDNPNGVSGLVHKFQVPCE